MIQVKDLYGEIERQDLCCVRLFDKYDNKIDEFIGNSPQDLIEHLKERYTIFKAYGRCKMWCATEAGGRANMKGAFKWDVSFASEKEAVEIAKKESGSEVSRLKETMELMVMMKGLFGGQDNSNALLEEKLARFKAENNFELEKLKLQQADPKSQYGWMAPLIMSGLGKSPAEISATCQLMGLAQVNGSPGANQVAAVENAKTTFEELQKMTNEEKNKKLNEQLDKVCKVVSAEQFIMLLELILEKPERVQKAITAAAGGLI